MSLTLHPARSLRLVACRVLPAPRSFLCKPRRSLRVPEIFSPAVSTVGFFCRFSILLVSATYKSLFPQAVCFLIFLKRPGGGLSFPALPTFRSSQVDSQTTTHVFSRACALFVTVSRPPSFLFKGLRTLFANTGGGPHHLLTGRSSRHWLLATLVLFSLRRKSR